MRTIRPEDCVTLSEADLQLVEKIVHLRADPKRQHGVPSQKIDPHRTDLDIDWDGVCAEVAAARYYDVLPCLYASLSGEDGHCDLVINGFRCEVKGKLKRQVGYDFALLTDDITAFKDDVGILVYRLAATRYEIFGVISRQKMLKVSTIRNFGYGNRAVVEAQYFSFPEILKKWEKVGNRTVPVRRSEVSEGTGS